MSAFLVTDAHINVLITFARHAGLVLPDPAAPDSASLTIRDGDHATAFGRALLEENLRSLRYRYGDRHDFIAPHAEESCFLARYRYRPDSRGHLDRQGNAIGIIKATHCYDYQACETPDYPTRWAARFMSVVRDAACHYLPGYEEAPWGFSELALH